MILEAFFQAGMPGVKEVILHLASGATRTVYCQVVEGESRDSAGNTSFSRPTHELTQTTEVIGDMRRGDSVTMDDQEYTAAHDAIAHEVHGLHFIEVS